MSDTRSQFIAAGLKLYPQYGYQKLPVRVLSAEAGLSAGMFHHLFEDKDAFIAEVLASQHERTFGRLQLDKVEGVDAFERLQRTLRLVALCLRDNLHWVQRTFADSGEGVEVVAQFWREHFGIQTQRLLALLAQCEDTEPSVQMHRLAYLSASVTGPMVIGTRLNDMGMLPQALSGHIADILEDTAIFQRINWALAALFPNQTIISLP